MRDELDEMQAYCARLVSDVADLALSVQQLREELADAVAGGNMRVKAPTFTELEQWVSDELAVRMYPRHTGPAFRWCERWFEHPEAVLRLSALLVGWKEAQQSGRTLAFLRDLDAQMAALSDPAGTFAACGREHYGPERLPCELPGAEFYDEGEPLSGGNE